MSKRGKTALRKDSGRGNRLKKRGIDTPPSKALRFPQLLIMAEGKPDVCRLALACPSALVGLAKPAGGFLWRLESLLCEVGFHCR